MSAEGLLCARHLVSASVFSTVQRIKDNGPNQKTFKLLCARRAGEMTLHSLCISALIFVLQAFFSFRFSHTCLIFIKATSTVAFYNQVLRQALGMYTL